jgi:hypothetical protein
VNSACGNDDNLGGFKAVCNGSLVEPHCRKMVQTGQKTKNIKSKKTDVLFFLVEKKTSIVRSCGSKIGAKSCYKTAGVNSVRQFFLVDFYSNLH